MFVLTMISWIIIIAWDNTNQTQYIRRIIKMWYKIRTGIELLLGIRNKDGSYKAKSSKN